MQRRDALAATEEEVTDVGVAMLVVPPLPHPSPNLSEAVRGAAREVDLHVLHVLVRAVGRGCVLVQLKRRNARGQRRGG